MNYLYWYNYSKPRRIQLPQPPACLLSQLEAQVEVKMSTNKGLTSSIMIQKTKWRIISSVDLVTPQYHFHNYSKTIIIPSIDSPNLYKNPRAWLFFDFGIAGMPQFN